MAVVFKAGDRVHVSGDSSELWIQDYNVRVDSDATVLVENQPYLKKVLVCIDSIDHDSNVYARVRKSKLQLI